MVTASTAPEEEMWAGVKITADHKKWMGISAAVLLTIVAAIAITIYVMHSTGNGSNADSEGDDGNADYAFDGDVGSQTDAWGGDNSAAETHHTDDSGPNSGASIGDDTGDGTGDGMGDSTGDSTGDGMGDSTGDGTGDATGNGAKSCDKSIYVISDTSPYADDARLIRFDCDDECDHPLFNKWNQGYYDTRNTNHFKSVSEIEKQFETIRALYPSESDTWGKYTTSDDIVVKFDRRKGSGSETLVYFSCHKPAGQIQEGDFKTCVLQDNALQDREYFYLRAARPPAV